MRTALAMTEQENEGPRLYSRQARVPQDLVLPKHQVIHVELDRWGRWNRERYQQGTCESLEKNFASGGREVKRPIVTLPPDPRNQQIERAVLRMLFEHGETTKLYYEKRRSPTTICQIFALRFEDFGKWMGDCRDMVLFLLEN